ncbi:MAG: type II toxin-antitoxin system VapC family toxin [Verrucomicrobiota bacterium]|jgi:predicted nucleic acid-binding protein|nr:type II toxin-antitoxin system VapC family toxin [Verrucomicrobiota bacterium]
MLLDSNIVIYAAQQEHVEVRRFIEAHRVSVSAITYVEVLGYHKLRPEARDLLADFFRSLPVWPVTVPVLDEAVRLRQARKLGLADSLIAATALVRGLPLATHNTADFAWIERLKVIDPLSGK